MRERRDTGFSGLVIAQLCVLAVLLIGFFIAQLALRSRIETAAAEVAQQERQLRMEQRRAGYVEARLAAARQPAWLLKRADELGLVVRAPDSDELYHAAPEGSWTAFISPGESSAPPPYETAFDLAVLRGMPPAP